MPVVVVESPAKAKTINRYLGKGFTVLASFGHVRDLPPKDGSVDPDRGFEMKWEVGRDSQPHIRKIADALKKDNALILATDPDREGEAISWHLEEALRKRRAIGKDTSVRRVVFNAVTERAVTEAMEHPRQVDRNLVEAYLARRALDYLVGFNLSPVLWRKLPGARSAGRVQSVCLRLIVEREMEIEAFDAQEYWSVKILLATERGEEFEARLVVLNGSKVEKLSLKNASDAEAAVQKIRSQDFKVTSVEAKPVMHRPSPPFMTSTLQQEASRKFRFGPRETMATAQRLYEAGLITYMRTDGIDMAPEAMTSARTVIGERYGQNYVPDKPRVYKNKAKNAQEAHECIRPTNMSLQPQALKTEDPGQLKLYDLIWKRTIASQMETAKLQRTTVDMESTGGEKDDDKKTGLRASGQVVEFDGFLRVYEEGRDDQTTTDQAESRLPTINVGETVKQRDVTSEQHFTQPPPRYTEATLVKKMEELGIGRPSTYASVVTTIQDREYVRKEKDRLFPEDKGRVVTVFLLNFFRKYVGYEFTANLEKELDDITRGERGWTNVLERFWQDFKAQVDGAFELRITEVLDKLDEALAPQLYRPRKDGSDPRSCPRCGTGRLHLKTSRSGGFIGCGNFPDCTYTRSLSGEAENGSQASDDDRPLGSDNGDDITLKSGRFGYYVQRGEAVQSGEKPPRASLPKGWSPESMTLQKALQLLSLPREVGAHPEDGELIQAGFSRYGPYIRHGKRYASLEEADDVFEIGMNRAVELLAQAAERKGRGGRSAPTPMKELGEHPEHGGPVNVMNGKYGPYVKWNKINATIPKNIEPMSVDMETAVRLIAERAAKGKSKRKPSRRPRKPGKAIPDDTPLVD